MYTMYYIHAKIEYFEPVFKKYIFKIIIHSLLKYMYKDY